jgi:hypothetical protein
VNASVSLTRFSANLSPSRPNTLRFGTTPASQQPVSESPQQAPANQEKPSAFKKVIGFVSRLFKIALEGLSWALGFEFIEAIMHKLIPHSH